MKIFRENDRISLTKPINGEVIGERREIVLPTGTVATVVLVYGDPDRPTAYEVEAHLPEQDCYALATVEAEKI